MEPILGKKAWRQAVSGYLIVDVAIRQSDIVYIAARKRIGAEAASHLSDPQIPSRIVALYLEDDPSDNFGCQEIEGMNMPVLGVSRAPFERPSGLLTSKDRDGDSWPHGGGSGPMEHIAPGKWPSTNRLKCIQGYTYSVGRQRVIYKREAVGKWNRFDTQGLTLSDDIPGITTMSTSRLLDVTSAMGFSDMDAFSESDMYAVGGHGDVWHYDGSRWQQQGFPSNVQLGTVTCAGDGNAYISGEGGSLWVGSKSSWKRVYEGGSGVLWNDVLWFNGQLWLASDYQFRIWDGKEMQSVMHEGKSVSMYGHMDAYDGLLAIASPEWVKTFDGQQWKTVVAPYLD